MSFEIKTNRDEKTGDLVAKVTNPGGDKIKQEYANMVAELMAIPGTEINIRIPTSDRVENQRSSSYFGAEDKKNRFESGVSFRDQGSQGTVAVVQLRGSLWDENDAKVLQNAMRPIKTDAVLFDLSKLEKLGNDGGLGRLVSEWKRVSDEGRTTMVAGPLSDSVREHLTITKLGTTFNVFPNSESALDWFSKAGPVKVARLPEPAADQLHS